MSAPFSRTFAAISRLTAGPTVLISTKIFPCAHAGEIPSGPFDNVFQCGGIGDHREGDIGALATSRGESAHCMPFSIRPCALALVRL